MCMVLNHSNLISEMDLSQLIEILHQEKCSCVISNFGNIYTYHQRGVKDLYELLINNRELLKGAIVADKVIGKGAAAIIAVGCVKSVYSDVISSPALELLKSAGISVRYGICVPNIINRAGTGICPVEALCSECRTAAECIPHIESFIKQIQQQ